MDGAWGTGTLVVSLFFLLVVVAGVVLAVRALGGSDGGGGTRSSDGGSRAMTILEERYARGDIGREDFEERRESLVR